MKNFEGHHQVEDPAEGEESHESRESVSSPESSAEFHFKEMADIEPAMASLAEKLKENIESGKYDTLISDDAGGRIPTLILRKIIKELNPDKKL